MPLVTGVYGMNVAHLPGASSFWLVLLLILASGGVTLVLLFWRRLL
jgi:Mg2+ and Co2+ transporter CorA